MTSVSIQEIKDKIEHLVSFPFNPILEAISFRLCCIFLTNNKTDTESMSQGGYDHSFRAISTGLPFNPDDYETVGDFLEEYLEGYQATFCSGIGFAPRSISSELFENQYGIVMDAVLASLGLSEEDQENFYSDRTEEMDDFSDWYCDEVSIDIYESISNLKFSEMLKWQLDKAKLHVKEERKKDAEKKREQAEEQKRRDERILALKELAGEGLIRLIENTIGNQRFEKKDRELLYGHLDDLSTLNTKKRVMAAMMFAKINVSNSLKELIQKEWTAKI